MALREARRDETALIVQLLADDPLGKTREDLSGDLLVYLTAFDAIAASPDNLLLVWDEESTVAGCLQLTFIPGLSRKGASRALIEGVRVSRDFRNRGIGEQMIRGAMALAAERGCALVELTTDKSREDAQRFYKRLGFVASHEGMKIYLG